MSDCDSEPIYSDDSERSEDSDSEGSIADFLADSDEEPEVCPSCHTEVCVKNIITNRKRRRTEVVADDQESSCNDSDDDDDSSYVPSEAGESSEDETSCDESDC